MNTSSIADYMTKDFASIRADMPVVEAARQLLRHHILGGPVTDAQRTIRGRGRDGGYPLPPAQIRTCSITA